MQRLEVKVALTVEDSGAIHGIAWPFGSPDMVGDLITKGAFAHPGALPMLWAHDQSQVVGVWDSIAETAKGLEVKGRLLIDDVERAREVRAIVKAGGAGGLSIGFQTKKAAPRQGGGRTISSLDLKEVSIVSVPSHPGARIITVKEAPMAGEEGAAAPTVEDRVGALETDVAAIKADVAAMKGTGEEAAKALTRIETKMNRPAGGKQQDAEVPIEQKAFGSFLRRGPTTMSLDEVKALRVADDTQGGYFATPEFSNEVLKGITEISPMRQVARVGSTGSGAVLLPKRTGRPNGRWVGETEPRQETGSTYGQVEVPVHEIACYVDVSQRLLEDAAVNVESEVSTDLSEEFGRMEGDVFLNGDGAKKPLGILKAPDLTYLPSGNASTLGSAPADLLISLIYSLPAPYRSRGSFMMNGSTLAAIRKLKDSSQGYLWQPSLAEGSPETILGRPVIEAPDMDDVAAGTLTIPISIAATAISRASATSATLTARPRTRSLRSTA
ncbi:MAG: phage major capsid protein [Phreatobacter sp.]|uniref:phage major capsid protein n=1 Tax=Phreatobacter sp. TaxID=1966341 RepID=UPI001A3D825A|nr:phage major capsid protein [Phreatobacter sp.]MBL8570949.1 phage major capsid protein [Phreatobacter sp.]